MGTVSPSKTTSDWTKYRLSPSPCSDQVCTYETVWLGRRRSMIVRFGKERQQALDTFGCNIRSHRWLKIKKKQWIKRAYSKVSRWHWIWWILTQCSVLFQQKDYNVRALICKAFVISCRKKVKHKHTSLQIFWQHQSLPRSVSFRMTASNFALCLWVTE